MALQAFQYKRLPYYKAYSSSSAAESRFLPVMMVDLARAARDFFKDLGFWAPETQNFRWPAGACAQSGVPALQVLEYLLGLIDYCKYWNN